MASGPLPVASGPIELATAALAVAVDPAAGAEITHVGAPGGANALAHYGWSSPCPAADSVSYGDSQSDWLSRYRGGWQELFPNSGDACEVEGVPMAFHGDVSLASWEVVAAGERACTLRCPARLPLVVERRMEIDADRPVLRLEQVVTNESDREVEFLWAHHPVFPATPGARIDLPSCRVEVEPRAGAGLAPGAGRWPRLRSTTGVEVDLSVVPDESLERLVYASEISEPWVALRQAGGSPSVAMSWDAAAFPCLWIWLQRHAPGFPHYGRAEMLGLEPQAAFPFDGLAAATRRGRARRVGPRGSLRSWLTMALFEADGRPVTGVGRDGALSFGSAA